MMAQPMMQPAGVIIQQAPMVVPEKKWVEMGPLWSTADAEVKADEWVKKHPGWKWTGEWKTTIPNEMSVIEVTNQLY